MRAVPGRRGTRDDTHAALDGCATLEHADAFKAAQGLRRDLRNAFQGAAR